MDRKHIFLTIVLALTLCSGSAFADVNPVTPSTNDQNLINGWAHVDQVATGDGYTDLEFISTRAFYSCFEYRTDGDTSQVIPQPGSDPPNYDNYNTDVTDGLYPYFCQNNNSRMETIFANEYVEVRMVFGAERDERFDWTRFEVGDKNDCKNGGWETLSRSDDSPFKNQGDCIQYSLTGK